MRFVRRWLAQRTLGDIAAASEVQILDAVGGLSRAGRG